MKRPLLQTNKATVPVLRTNALVPRRDSTDLAEPIAIVAPWSKLSALPDSPYPTFGEGTRPSYQAIVSPMPLLLDSLAGSIASVPAFVCEDRDIDEFAPAGRSQMPSCSSSGSSYSDGDGRCYSSRPTPSELSINAPNCSDDEENDDYHPLSVTAGHDKRKTNRPANCSPVCVYKNWSARERYAANGPLNTPDSSSVDLWEQNLRQTQPAPTPSFLSASAHTRSMAATQRYSNGYMKVPDEEKISSV